MKPRCVRTLTACLAVALLVAGCASDSSTATQTTAPPTAPTPTTEPPTTGPAATAPNTTAAATTAPPTTEVLTTEAPSTTTVTTTAEQTGPLTVQQLLDIGRPIVLAHAAGEDQFPHSSPYGYGESAIAGVDMLDFDVQLTADGVLVIQHDDTTGRTADEDLVVAESTYAQLHELDNAYWFTADCVCVDQPEAAYIYRGIRTGDAPVPNGYSADDFAITRFSDIAERFPDLPVNIEIKGVGEPAVAAAKQLALELGELGLEDNAVVASFDDAVVAAFHEFAPSIEISPGLNAATQFILDDVALPDGMRILQLPPRYGDLEVLSAETMTKVHAAGYVVWVWPNDRSLENAAGYEQLLQQGMDGLNINFPELGVQAVALFTG